MVLRDLRRVATAIALSLTAHAGVLVVFLGTSLWRAWPALPIEIDVATMEVAELAELPLGIGSGAVAANTDSTAEVISAPPPLPPPQPQPAVAVDSKSAPRPQAKPRPRPTPQRPVPPIKPQPRATGPAFKPTSVRSYAPEGSRVVALIRLDRLRGTPFADAVDSVLLLLPDRRDLIEGTDLDLYRDVDALLVATPNPRDAFATLLVVRHRLSDAALKSALDKGARATRRKLIWRTERGRPFAERVSLDGPATATATAVAPPRRRDQRLILLAAPKLAVVTPPSYRRLLLPPRPGASATSSTPAASATSDDGNDDGWVALINKIDAEDSILPDDGVAMLSASGIFAPSGNRKPRDATPVAASTDDTTRAGSANPAAAGPSAPAASVAVLDAVLPAPALVTAVLGIKPQPFANIDVAFDAPDSAARWLLEWPKLRRQLLANPIVVLTGLAHILAGVSVEQNEATLHIHLEATADETVRILSFLATQLPLLRR